MCNGAANLETSSCFSPKMTTLFGGEEHARLYIRYRPEYPVQLYDRILEYLDEGGQIKPRTLAVDAGCGSGQNTRVFGKYFDKVIGVDTSEAQVEEARKSCSDLANVIFQSGSADDLNGLITDGSVDLVTAATAMHWFDVEAFFGECLRILRPGGVLAAFAYAHGHFNDPMTERVYHQFVDVTLHPYWAPQVRLPLNRYKDVFPILQQFFPESERDDSFEIKFGFNIEEFCGYLSTFSAYHAYRRQNPTNPDPLIEVATELEGIYGTRSKDEKVVNGHLSIFMLLGKKL